MKVRLWKEFWFATFRCLQELLNTGPGLRALGGSHIFPELPAALHSHWEDVVVVAGTPAGPSTLCGLQTSLLSPSPLKVVKPEVLIPLNQHSIKSKVALCLLPSLVSPFDFTFAC